jgi:hypothetical protein
MSNGTFFSFVRHWTHGNFANVAIPEKTASAVTGTKKNPIVKRFWVRTVRALAFTSVVTGIHRLVWEPDVVQRHLIFVVVAMTHTGRREGQHEQWEKLRLENHLEFVNAKSIHQRGFWSIKLIARGHLCVWFVVRAKPPLSLSPCDPSLQFSWARCTVFASRQPLPSRAFTTSQRNGFNPSLVFPNR